MARTPPSNAEIADVLERVADLLEAQGADGFRVRAYRAAATSVRSAGRAVSELVDSGGLYAVEQLEGVGKSIGALICEYAQTGRAGLLARLEGQVCPEDLFATIPGIGEKLAARIHAKLGITTLEQLELAAHSGRLQTLPGFGTRRARAVREVLGQMLGRSVRARHAHDREPSPEARDSPRVGALLSADAEYRARAQSGDLKRIAPRRFNPEGEAWLPILHTRRDGWTLTALYSNTWRAHELGKNRDWVVLFAEREGQERQFTVVTETRGSLLGRRVVRGRELECQEHYGALERADADSQPVAHAS